MPDESAVLDALSTVDDPEAGMSIVALGLVYNVAVSETEVKVEMTMTSPACPVADSLVEQARAAIAAIAPADAKINVTLVWEPFWQPSMNFSSGTARAGPLPRLVLRTLGTVAYLVVGASGGRCLRPVRANAAGRRTQCPGTCCVHREYGCRGVAGKPGPIKGCQAQEDIRYIVNKSGSRREKSSNYY